MDETVKNFKARRDARIKKRMDDFKEGDHPRDENGRFTSGGGSRASSGPNKVIPAKNLGKKESASRNKVGKAYPTPKSLDMNSVSMAYSNAVDRGQDPVDVLKTYTRAYDKGIKITLGDEKYTKVGENKWKPENPWATRSSSGFDDDREMAMKIANNFMNQEEARIEGLKWKEPKTFKGGDEPRKPEKPEGSLAHTLSGIADNKNSFDKMLSDVPEGSTFAFKDPINRRNGDQHEIHFTKKNGKWHVEYGNQNGKDEMNGANTISTEAIRGIVKGYEPVKKPSW